MTYKIFGPGGAFVVDVDEQLSPGEQVRRVFDAMLNSFLDKDVIAALKEYWPSPPSGPDKVDQIRNIITSMSNLVGPAALVDSVRKNFGKIVSQVEAVADIENEGNEVIWSDYSSIAHIHVKAKYFLSRDDNKTTIKMKDAGSVLFIPKKEINVERPYFEVNKGDVLSIKENKEIVLTVKSPEVTITSSSPPPQQQIQKY